LLPFTAHFLTKNIGFNNSGYVIQAPLLVFTEHRLLQATLWTLFLQLLQTLHTFEAIYSIQHLGCTFKRWNVKKTVVGQYALKYVNLNDHCLHIGYIQLQVL